MANPRRLNEQIRKVERLSIPVRILQVGSVPNFGAKFHSNSEALAGADSTLGLHGLNRKRLRLHDIPDF